MITQTTETNASKHNKHTSTPTYTKHNSAEGPDVGGKEPAAGALPAGGGRDRLEAAEGEPNV